MLDVHLDRLAWDVQLGAPLRSWPVTLLGDAEKALNAASTSGMGRNTITN
jgi:hypothetical protein